MELILLVRAERDVLTLQVGLNGVAKGLGDRFNLRVEETLDRLVEFPRSGSMYSAPFRRVLIPDFPMAAFYSVEGRRIIVQTVLDLRQSPAAIARKLRGD